MDKMNLYKCAQALSVKWKSFFGLGTEYVGYFKIGRASCRERV